MKRLLLIFSMILLASCKSNDLSKDFRDTKAYFTEFKLFNNDYVVLSTEENNYCKKTYEIDGDPIAYFVNTGFEKDFENKHPGITYINYFGSEDQLEERAIYKLKGVSSDDLLKTMISFGGTYFRNTKYSLTIN